MARYGAKALKRRIKGNKVSDEFGDPLSPDMIDYALHHYERLGKFLKECSEAFGGILFVNG